jgi:hypothetical protein
MVCIDPSFFLLSSCHPIAARSINRRLHNATASAIARADDLFLTIRTGFVSSCGQVEHGNQEPSPCCLNTISGHLAPSTQRIAPVLNLALQTLH